MARGAQNSRRKMLCKTLNLSHAAPHPSKGSGAWCSASFQRQAVFLETSSLSFWPERPLDQQ